MLMNEVGGMGLRVKPNLKSCDELTGGGVRPSRSCEISDAIKVAVRYRQSGDEQTHSLH